MKVSNIGAVIEGIRTLHESMSIEDAYYYHEAAENFVGELIRFSGNVGVGSISFYDLFAQKEYTSLTKARELNDLHHRTAAFIGMCAMEEPDTLSILADPQASAGRHDALVNHIRKNISADDLSDQERSELDERLDELADYKGNMPAMVIKLWRARNAMGERLGIGPEVNEALMVRIDNAWKGFVSKKPAATEKPSRQVRVETASLAYS